MSNTKRKPVKEFGKLYEYLKDHALRTEERGTGHIDIKDADFTGLSIDGGFYGTWQNFIFTNCLFPTSQVFQLKETTGCIFNSCEFGPGRKDVAMSFGTMKNCTFTKCTFTNGSVSFGLGEATFNDCEFENTTSSNRSWNHYIAGHNLLLNNCKFRFYDLTGRRKLHMKGCDYMSSGSGSLDSGKEHYVADFIFEDTRLANAEKLLWNNKINNLTLRGCAVRGVFSAQHGHIRDTITLERLKVGTYHLNRSGTEKKITVRDCHFSEVNESTTYLFSCSGDYAAEFLMERVEGSAAAAINLTGASSKTTEQFRMETTRNQTLTLRGCKIPHLMLHWLQTHNLVIEGCEFDRLELPNGRIGTLTIRDTRFNTLDLTNTLATKFDIQPSGQVAAAGSNYPQGGYKIDGSKK